MGIEGLMKIIRTERVAVNAELGFKVFGIDASIWMHKFKYVDGCELGIDRNHDGWKCAFVNTFKTLAELGKLVFVFDGKTPKCKEAEHLKRREGFSTMKEVALKLLEVPEMRLEGKRMLVKLIEVSELSSQLKTIIEDNGWEWKEAEYEADTLLAIMSLKKEIDVIVTEDTDLVVYGCENIVSVL